MGYFKTNYELNIKSGYINDTECTWYLYLEAYNVETEMLKRNGKIKKKYCRSKKGSRDMFLTR